MTLKSVKTFALASACALLVSGAAIAQTNTNNGNTNGGNMNGGNTNNTNVTRHTNRGNPTPGTPRRVRRGRNPTPGTRRGPINSNGNTNNGNTH